MFNKLVLAVAAAALLTACGGGSEPAETKPTPEPRSYTLKELKAALPGKGDVADVSRVDYTCPDKERCPAPDEGDIVGITFTLPPAGDNPADVERAANESLLDDFVSVYVWRHQDASAATKDSASSLARDKNYDGAYDVKQEGDPETGTTPGEKGEGSLEMLEIGAWEGHLLKRHGTMTFQDRSEPRVQATAEMVQGSVTVSINVNAHANGRPADFADKLARKTLDDYLKSLG